MLKRTSVAAAFLAFPLAVMADTPNVEPGLWEYTATTTVEGAPVTIPPNENVFQQCITLEDLQEPDFLMEDMDECEVSNLVMDSSGMSYMMSCTESESGSTIDMRAEASFEGDRMNGIMNGQMQSPMGELTMTVVQVGQRIGDCDE